jgi:hypothetical protein
MSRTIKKNKKEIRHRGNPVAKARATGEHGPKRAKMVHVSKKNRKPKYAPVYLDF